MDILEKLGQATNWKRTVALAVAGLGVGLAVTWGTPSMGFVVNQILAMGGTDNINQQVQIARDPNAPNDEPWQVQLQAQGATDFYVQKLGLAPGGYSGWHLHPGVLIGTVVSGSIDFYDGNCRKTSYKTGQAFQENNQVHAIINNGGEVAELSIVYLVKRGAARRLEADAPACAPDTMIP